MNTGIQGLFLHTLEDILYTKRWQQKPLFRHLHFSMATFHIERIFHANSSQFSSPCFQAKKSSPNGFRWRVPEELGKKLEDFEGFNLWYSWNPRPFWMPVKKVKGCRNLLPKNLGGPAFHTAVWRMDIKFSSWTIHCMQYRTKQLMNFNLSNSMKYWLFNDGILISWFYGLIPT